MISTMTVSNLAEILDGQISENLDPDTNINRFTVMA